MLFSRFMFLWMNKKYLSSGSQKKVESKRYGEKSIKNLLT